MAEQKGLVKNNDTMKKVEVDFGVNINVKRTICITDEAVDVLEKLSNNNNEILLLRKFLDKDLSSVGFDIIATSVKLSRDIVTEQGSFGNIKWRVINDDEQ